MIALWLCFAAAPPTVFSGPIRDTAGLFSAPARASAVEQIAELKKRHGYELRVETVETQPSMNDVPGILYKGVREARLQSWVRDLARGSGLEKGIYVVVSLHPPDVRLAGWPAETENRFQWSRREEMRSGMRKFLRDRQYDRALTEAVDRFASVLEQTHESPSPLATLPLLAVIGALTGGWLVLCVVRRRVLGFTAAMYPPAVQGGLFGTLAASWIYDRLFHVEKEATKG